MSITQSEAKKRLAQLSAQGGGIISGSKKLEIDEQSNVLVIGLGGLGCKTVNELVGVYKKDFENQGRLSYIAIDTDSRCFDKISSLNGGNIEQNDMFSIYDNAGDIQNLLQLPRTPYINSFVNSDVPPHPITNQGAQQRRIVGKVMLCGGTAYGALRRELERRINAMGGGNGGRGMQIIIVAGISGGTGSGTFIDVSYMVRELAKDNGNNSVFGVFYTPDVQKNEAWCNDTIWDNLQRNGYSSMKELDYFMSVGNGNKVVYSLPLNSPITIDGVPVTKIESKLPIFEREYVFIISETDTNKSEQDIIGATAISLLNLFRKSTKMVGENTQNILSNLCNIVQYIGTWSNNNIGKCNDPNRTRDPAKIKYTNYPVSMHYSYASFDYKSVYIPRNEMAAYCTNLILNDLLHNKFVKALESISNNDVAQLAQLCGLESIESIYSVADTQSGWHNVNLRVPSNSAAYPQPGALRIRCDATATVEEARQIAQNAISAASADMNVIWSVFENAINTNLLNNNTLWNLVGPYGVIVFMSGGNGNGVNGLIQHVDNLQTNYNAKLQALQSAYETTEDAMLKYQKALAEDMRVTDAEVLRMVDLCEAFSKAYYDYQLYAQAMPYVLNTIKVKLSELNNRTFETYVPVMQAIEDIVNEDANRFMHSTLEKRGYGTVYCVDAFNIDNALASSSLFESFFEGYLNNREVIKAEENLFSTLFNAENRSYWEALTTADDMTAAENNAVRQVRKVFKTITDPLISSMLEKFLVMIYCDPQTFKNAILQPGENRQITLADLNDFWNNNPQDRDAALRIAAEKILSELNSGGMIKYGVDAAVREPFDSVVEVVSIPDLPKLNLILQNMIGLLQNGSFSIALPSNGDQPKTEISLFKNSGPFPLTFVNRMRQYAVRYFASEQAAETAAGRHGDEATECWQENMPELYGVDADEYFETTKAIGAISPEEHPRGNHDRRVFDEARNIARAALKGGYLYLPAGEDRYKLVVLKKGAYSGNPQLTVDELINKIICKLREMLHQHDLLTEDSAQLPTWVDAVKALGQEEQHNERYYLEEHYLDVNVRVINSIFCEVQAVKPEFDYEISNLERLIRMDMTILDELRDEVVFYQEKDFFTEIERMTLALRREQGLQKLVGYYLAAYKLGWISVDKGHLVCTPDKGDAEDLLDCRTGFGTGLDSQLQNFLKISAFCTKAEFNDIIKKRIQTAYKDYQLTDDQLSPEQLKRKAAMPDWKADILLPLRDLMESDDFKDYDMNSIYDKVFKKFCQSRYQNTYGYPLKVTCGKDILDNVRKVLDSLEYYAEAGDNNLIFDID